MTKHEVKIPLDSAKITDEVRRGVYANELFVAQTSDEVIFDFIQTTLGAPHNLKEIRAEVVSRVVMSKALAIRIQRLILAQDFGALDEDLEDASQDAADRESA